MIRINTKIVTFLEKSNYNSNSFIQYSSTYEKSGRDEVLGGTKKHEKGKKEWHDGLRNAISLRGSLRRCQLNKINGGEI